MRRSLTARIAAGVFAVALLAGAAGCNSDADPGDTTPQNNTENPTGDAPGGIPGGSDSEGEGTGTGRSDSGP